MHITRRRFTAGLGAGLLAGAFLPWRTARAQAAPARRLLIFYSPNGTIHRHWRPEGGERDFRFPAGSILEPLAARRGDLLVVDGLNFLTGNNHEGGQAAMLTNGGGAGTPTRGMSLDQYVASRIGAMDRFPSLELGVLTDIWGANIQTRISYRAAGELVHPDADPRRAFERLFADLAGGPDGAARRRAQRRSVIDLARAELGDLHRRIGREEQVKLEAHLEALRSMEQSLFAEMGGCASPLAPDPLGKDENDNVPALLAAQMDLAVTALACGMTRVATVQLSHTVSPVVFSWAGNTDQHHSLSHADDGQAEAVGQFVAAERWCAEQFGALLDRLENTADPAGGTLLDSTLVVWAKEMGDSRLHVCEAVPFVLAGGGIGGGRYLRFSGESHAHLLVSICQHMGLDNDTFGDPASGRGPLAGVG